MLTNVVLREARVQVFRGLYNGGPVLGTQYESLRHQNRYGAHDKFLENIVYKHKLPGTWTYCAPAYPHFGHTMAELIHRILPSMELFGPKNFLMLGGPNTELFTRFIDLPDFWQQLFDYFGVDRDSLLIIHDDVVVETLNIVEQGASLSMPPKASYLTMLRGFSESRFKQLQPKVVDHDRVYVSRSEIVPTGGILGERCIEKALQKSGFLIFHPQHGYSIVEQAAQYLRAKQLIFSEGSACHGAEIIGQDMLNQVGFISRRLSHTGLFEEVLAPRSKSFTSYVDIAVLGTLSMHPQSGVPQDNLGVSVVNPASLQRFLTAFIDEEVDLNGDEYVSAALADLASYVLHYDAVGSDAAIEMERVALTFLGSSEAPVQ